MSYLNQRLANRFPKWTKVRRDPSSLGQRMFGAFSYGLEENLIDNKWLSEELHLLRRRMGPGSLYAITLEEDDALALTSGDGGMASYANPTLVEGTDFQGVHTVVQVEVPEDLTNDAPDRISVYGTDSYANLVAYDSVSGVYSTGLPVERYAVLVENSTTYFPKNYGRNPSQSGRHEVQVEGVDENYMDVIEEITIRDDGVFMTHNWWRSLDVVSSEGFDGSVTLQLPMQLPWIVDPYRPLVLKENEGELQLRLRYNGETLLVMTTDILKEGVAYRTGNADVPENIDVLGYMTLRDSAGNPIVGMDLAVSPENAMLYVIDDAGFMHVYDHGLPTFDPPSEQIETRDSYIELHPVIHYEAFGVEARVWTYFARQRYPVKTYSIKRVAPDGTEAWLDSSKNWVGAEFVFEGPKDPNTVEETFEDFSFSTLYDQEGQWDYYMSVGTPIDQTVYHTAVMVYELRASVSLDTSIVNPVGIYFSQNGRVAVADATDITYFNEHRDRYLVDYSSQRLIMTENYDSVEVTV